MTNYSISVLLCIACFVISTRCALQCRDENNEAVDWFVLYKLPRSKNSDNPLIRDGMGYVYMTDKSVFTGWTLSEKSINDTSSFPGQTVHYLYNNLKNEELLWVLYNDQPPSGGSIDSKGHTKGVIMSDSLTGFWLVHSVPHYLPAPGNQAHYSYPATGLHYGQSFLCISLDIKQLNYVGTVLMYNEPYIYSRNIPASLETAVPHLLSAASNVTIDTPPWNYQVDLTSLLGAKFTSFAKSSHFKKDLYADWLTVALQSNLLVETWSNGKGKLPSECSKPFKVMNIGSVNINSNKFIVTNFSSHLDHSKWAVSASLKQNSHFVCIGDINRMMSQEKRGGGTVCSTNDDMWNAFRNAVNSIESCPRRSDISVYKNNLNNFLPKF